MIFTAFLMDDPIDSQNPSRDGGRGAWLPMAGAVTGALLLMAGVWFIVVCVPAANKRALYVLDAPGISDPKLLAMGIDESLRMASLSVSLVAMKRAENGGNGE